MSSSTDDGHDVCAIVSRKLRFLMQTNHVTLQQLADKLDIGHVSLQEIADGQAIPTSSIVGRLCRFFEVSEDYFGTVASAGSAGTSSPAPTSSARNTTRAKSEKLTLKSLAIRHQALLEVLIDKGLLTAAEFRDQVTTVESR